MRNVRLVDGLSIVLVAHLLSGCVIRIGPLDDQGMNGADEPSALPAPRPPGGGTPAPSEDEPALDDAAQARRDEVDKYIREVIYHGATITDSYVLPSGDVVDFLDRNTLPPTPELPELPFSLDLTVPPGVELGLSELEQIPELLAIAQTATPFTRPTFWAYILGETDATSIKDYLDRYQVGGAPSGSEHLHAGWLSKAENRGASSFINYFRPEHEVEEGTFSLMEMIVACPADGDATEMIGVVISIDKVNPFQWSKQALADNQARLHVEYAVPDPVTGKAVYHWENADDKFHRTGIRHRVGEKVDVSEIGGKQVEHFAAIFQDWHGGWWIMYQGELLGYYEADVFTALKGLDKSACRTQWYGEVARRKPSSPTPWTATEMGSGKFPDINDKSNTAYVRNPMFYDPTWIGLKAESVPHGPMTQKPGCYNHSKFQDGPLGDRLFYVGGAGGKDPAACVWP